MDLLAVNVDFVMSVEFVTVSAHLLMVVWFCRYIVYIGILWSKQLFFVEVDQQEVARGVRYERGKKNGCTGFLDRYRAVCRFSRTLGRFQFVGRKMSSFEIPFNLQIGTFLVIHNVFL